MEAYLRKKRIEVLSDALPEEGWTLTDRKSQQLLLKLKSQGVPLSEYVEGKESKKRNPTSNTKKIENQIDQLVYELYGLTEEEIGIVEYAAG